MEYERGLYRIYERAMEEVPSLDSPSDSISFFPPLISYESWRAFLVRCGNFTRKAPGGSQSNINFSRLPSSPITRTNSEMRLESGILTENREAEINTGSVGNHYHATASNIDEQEDGEYSDHDTARSSAVHLRSRQYRQYNRPQTAAHPLNTNRVSNSYPTSKLLLSMRVMLWSAVFHIILIFIIHLVFVSAVRSKALSVRRSAKEGYSWHRSTTAAPTPIGTCVEYALSSRPREDRINRYFNLFGDYDYVNTTENVNTTNIEPPLLFHDEILQIRVIPESMCERSTVPCSRVHSVQLTPNSTDQSVVVANSSSSLFWDKAMYQYSTDRSVFNFNERMRFSHNISIVNLTLTYSCLVHGQDVEMNHFLSRAIAIFIYLYNGIDTVILNQLMYGIRSTQGNYRDGVLKNLVTKESWIWQASMIDESEQVKSNIILGLFNKMGIMIASLLAFFLITSVTAFLVRVLTSSGVVIMFPIFALLRTLGLPDADERLLLYSYPWIGHQRQAASRQRMYAHGGPLIAAHMAKLFLCYVLYEAAESEWGYMFYGKGSYFSNETTSLWIYGFFTLVEYFSLIFVRSALSARFFSRITLLYFVAYHFYFYSAPYSFYGVALIPWFCLIVHSMLFTLLVIEQPALSRGAISYDCPREVFTKLSWSEFAASIPHEFTIFLPLNARYIPVHDHEHIERANQNRQESQNTETTEIHEEGSN